ncbi:hypothetical protein [Marinicellulosiphila megalodicopiae]|uniref:hypothetical protein n=1 Tax=Marinicellulosiphila megalodicopiae TaxID=2724896 RepID=UPI003BB0CCBA
MNKLLVIIFGLTFTLNSIAEVKQENIFITDIGTTTFTVAWYQDNADEVEVEFLNESGQINESIIYSTEYSQMNLRWDSNLKQYQNQNLTNEISQSLNDNGLRRVTFSNLKKGQEYLIQLTVDDIAISDVINISTALESEFLLSGEQLLLTLPVDTINYLVVVTNEINNQAVSSVISSSETAINLNAIISDANNSFDVKVINEFGFEHVGLNFEFDLNVEFNVVRTHQYEIFDTNESPVLTALIHQGSLYDDQIIELSSSANDLEQGDISNEIIWQSNLEGVLGQGAVIDVMLMPGEHVISALVRDNQGKFNSLDLVLNILESDSDSDGFRDKLEFQYFSDLTQTLETDFDNDGLNNSEELGYGLNPAIFDLVLTMPMVNAPLNSSEIFEDSIAPFLPELSVVNASHIELIQVQYIFELSSESDFSNVLASSLIDESNINTTWLLMEDELTEALIDNQTYYWRARAQSITNTPILTDWVYADFFINSQNDAPVYNEVIPLNTQISNVQPELFVSGISDIDNDDLTIQYRVYDSNDLLIAQSSALSVPSDGNSSWTLDVSLIEDTQYYWLAEISDSNDQVITSNAEIFVSTQNHAPLGLGNLSPNGELSTSFAELRSDAAIDPEGQAVSYMFELADNNLFDDATSKEVLVEMNGSVIWSVSDLVENQMYYWRVKASDNTVSSQWLESEFFVNETNEAPEQVLLQSPANLATLNTLVFPLEVFETSDVDSDSVTYIFNMYSDINLEDSVLSMESDSTSITIESGVLSNNQNYYWNVIAVDEEALQSAPSDTFEFNIMLPILNQAPRFEFVFPIDQEIVEAQFVTIQWEDEDEDSNALISLFAVSDAQRIEIVAGLEEDLDGKNDSYEWNLQGVDAGDYRIEAHLSDEEHDVEFESCCFITVLEVVVDIVVDLDFEQLFVGESHSILASAVTNTGNDVSENLVWTSSLDGNVSNSSVLGTQSLSVGEHEIRLSVIVDDIKYEHLIQLTVLDVVESPEDPELPEEPKEESGSISALVLILMLISLWFRAVTRNRFFNV